MRLTGQIRRDEGLRTPSNADSAYRVSTLRVNRSDWSLIDSSFNSSPSPGRLGDLIPSKSPVICRRDCPMPLNQRSPSRRGIKLTCNRGRWSWSQRRRGPSHCYNRFKPYARIRERGVMPKRRSNASSIWKRSPSWKAPRWTNAKMIGVISFVWRASSRSETLITMVGERENASERSEQYICGEMYRRHSSACTCEILFDVTALKLVERNRLGYTYRVQARSGMCSSNA